MKIVLSRSGKFTMTLHLMVQYWMDSVSTTEEQHCFNTTIRPDLILGGEGFRHLVEEGYEFHWDGINPNRMWDLVTNELLEFRDDINSRCDPKFIAVVERSLPQFNTLEVVEVPPAMVEKGFHIQFELERNREFIELNT